MRDADELTIVSNRLPIVLQRKGEGPWRARPGAGGLIQALNPLLQQHGGCWVGWPGVVEEQGSGWQEHLQRCARELGYHVEPVALSQAEYDGFYQGFSNSVLWPLFHGFAERCHFAPAFYEAYRRVNKRFAHLASQRAQVSGDGLLWVHDYHLMYAGQCLRERDADGMLSFFLHIPFPSLENFAKLPWREDILRALLAYDLVGFQTARDARNFAHCLEQLLPQASLHQAAGSWMVDFDGMRTHAGAFPIGMDFDSFASRAATPVVVKRIAELRRELGACAVLLGVDRLDYSKGLLERFAGLEEALERYPALRQKVVLLQLVVPSRESVPQYQGLKREVDRVVGRINGRFATPGWQPIRYVYNAVDQDELLALYGVAQVALVTPLRDGMNLVAKEYCAAHIHDDGVLVLSEFAGASAQLQAGALLVNPYDRVAMAEAIYRALHLGRAERRRRMRALRAVLSREDVFFWASSFMAAAQAVRASRDGARLSALPWPGLPATSPHQPPSRAPGPDRGAV